MKRWLTASFVALAFIAGPARAQVGGPNADLISQLSSALGSTPDQAAGAAGAIFSLAKSNLPPNTWEQVQLAIPGVREMMQAVPGKVNADTVRLPVDTTFGGRGGSSLSGAFSRLGLSQDQIGKAVPIISDYVTKAAGPEVGQAFAAALH